LQEIATSPRYGAPPAISGAILTATSSPDPFSAAVDALTDGSNGRMVGLFVALLAITAVSLGFAAARRRTI
jgi:Ca2+/Na+ antiporter